MKNSIGAIINIAMLVSVTYSTSLSADEKSLNIDNIPESILNDSSCNNKNTKYKDLYSGNYMALLGHTFNSSSNVMYLHKYEVRSKGNYVLFNPTITSKEPNGGALVFNRPFLKEKNWVLLPNESVRHLTTAEEYKEESKFQYGLWAMDNPYVDKEVDGKIFNYANVRNSGEHPNNVTLAPNYDAEIISGTLFDRDNNLTTQGDNEISIACYRINIRWCGDGIVDNKYEQCDPSDKSHFGWSQWGCSPTCKSVISPVK